MGLPAVNKVDPMHGDAIYQKVKQESGVPPCQESSQSTAIQSQNQSDAGDRPGDRPPRAIRKLLRSIRKQDKQSTRFVDALRQLEQEILSSDQDLPPITDRLKSIEDELLFKRVAEDKIAMTMDRLRTNVRTALALQLSQVVTNVKEVKEVTGLLRSVTKEAKSAKRQENVNPGNRKRALSVNTPGSLEGQSPKIRKVDHKPAEEHMYITASGDWLFTSAKISPPIGWKFNLKEFMARRKKPKIRRCAKRYFIAGKQLFEFHSWQACQAAGSTAIEATWQSLNEGHRAEWEDLLSKLHDGQKGAVSDVGRTLLQKHNSRHRAARQTNATNEASSQVPAETIEPRDASKEALAKDWRASSPSTSQYTPRVDEAAKQDGVRRSIRWSDAEKRILLKGTHHRWSNEKIRDELPSIRPRTLAAVASAKAAIKLRYPNGLPVIRADTPFPFTPSRTPTTRDASSSVSPGPNSNEEHVKQHAESPFPKSREPAHNMQCKRAMGSDGAASIVAQPRFLLFPIRPPVTPETQHTEYFFLSVDTPECPVRDATEEEVSEACLKAFGQNMGFHSARNLQGVIWVAEFKRPRDRAALEASKFRVLDTLIKYRGYQFPPRYLPATPPRTFMASITGELGLVIKPLVTAIRTGFSGRAVMPNLALQTIPRRNMPPARKILAHFPQSPGLAQFYIPVLVGYSRRCVHVRFGPLNVWERCLLCNVHHPDGWCNKAVELRYSD